MVYRTIPGGYALAVATIAQNLKRLREEAAMTQEDLAASAKLKQAAISKYEMGKASPNVKSLMKLAIGLGRPLDALVRDVNDDYTALVVARAPVDAPASAGVDSEKVRTIAAELRLHIETLINRVEEIEALSRSADAPESAARTRPGTQASARQKRRAR